MCLQGAAVISAVNTLTWKSGQDAGVGTSFLWVFRRVFGLEELVEVEKFSVPPVDEILTPSFNLHLNHKALGEKRTHESALFLSFFVCLKVCGIFLNFIFTYKVVNEAFLLLNISNGGADRDIVRQLIKVTE